MTPDRERDPHQNLHEDAHQDVHRHEPGELPLRGTGPDARQDARPEEAHEVRGLEVDPMAREAPRAEERPEPRPPCAPADTADLLNAIISAPAPDRPASGARHPAEPRPEPRPASGREEGPARTGASAPFPDPRVLADRTDPQYDAAWRELMRRLGPRVRRIVAADVRRPADRADVEATIWAAAVTELPASLPRPAVGRWLDRVVTRALARLRRAEAARAAQAVGLGATFVTQQTAAAADAQDRLDVLTGLVAEETDRRRRAAVARFLAACTPDERVLLAASAHAVPHAEIAPHLGCTPAASRQRLRALLQRARAILAEGPDAAS